MGFICAAPVCKSVWIECSRISFTLVNGKEFFPALLRVLSGLLNPLCCNVFVLALCDACVKMISI